MAYTYKNARLVVTGSYVTAYTCPASTTAILLAVTAANIDGSNTVTASLQWLDSSAADAATRLVSVVSIPVGAAINLLAGEQVLEAGDALQALAGATSDVELSVSVLEIT